MSTLLKGYVMKILNPSTVIISLGRLNGVKKHMKFVIYEEGEMIIDPKTKAQIERLELVKGEIEVVHVQEKVSIAESYSIEERTAYSPLATMFPYSTKEEVKIKKHLTREKIEEASPSPLKVGDLVRQIE